MSQRAEIEVGVIAGERESDRLEVVRAGDDFVLRMQSAGSAGWHTYKRMAFTLEQLRELRGLLAVIDGAERMKEALAHGGQRAPEGQVLQLDAARKLRDA